MNNRNREFNTAEDDDEEEPQISRQATEILSIIHGLIGIAVEHGFALNRWSTMVSCMIYKKPGNIKLEELRCIHLMQHGGLGIRHLYIERAKHSALNQVPSAQKLTACWQVYA